MILESAVVMLVLIWYNKLKMNKACGIIGIDSVVIMLIITGSGGDLFAKLRRPFHSLPSYYPVLFPYLRSPSGSSPLNPALGSGKHFELPSGFGRSPIAKCFVVKSVLKIMPLLPLKVNNQPLIFYN